MNKLPILLNEKRISYWAYSYCKNRNDPIIREYITYTDWAFYYCKNINDDPKIRKNITNPYWAFRYCKEINMNDERLIELAKEKFNLYE